MKGWHGARSCSIDGRWWHHPTAFTTRKVRLPGREAPLRESSSPDRRDKITFTLSHILVAYLNYLTLPSSFVAVLVSVSCCSISPTLHSPFPISQFSVLSPPPSIQPMPHRNPRSLIRPLPCTSPDGYSTTPSASP